MNTHVFQAQSMGAAVAQVKAKLGPNALILSTRSLRKGGLFHRSRGKLVEITAADPMDDVAGIARSNRSGSFGKIPASLSTAGGRVSLPRVDVPGWLDSDSTANAPSLANDRRSAGLFDRSTEANEQLCLSQQVKSLFESFIARHIAAALASRLLQDLPADLDSTQALESNPLLARIEKLIPTSGPIQPGLPGKPRIVSFVGPTGVGKTTTIAKLAAQYKLQHNASVALLTIDTYRIAAVDQLRTYADIIDVPFSVVLSPKELSHELARLSDRSLIFIDTAGRNPNDHLRLGELRSFHQVMGSCQTQLVLAATAAYPQMISAIEKFSPLGIDQLLLTKLDEVVSLSPILNVFANLPSDRAGDSPMALSYVTVGQDVPDDIEVASSRGLAARILEEHCD